MRIFSSVILAALWSAVAAAPSGTGSRLGQNSPRRLFVARGSESLLDSVQWSPNGQELSCLLRDGPLVFVDSRSGRPSRRAWTLPRSAQAVALSPRWRRLAISHSMGTVEIWDVRTRRCRRRLPGRTAAAGLFWNPDENRLAITSGGTVGETVSERNGEFSLVPNGKNRILIFDSRTGRLRRTLRHMSRDGGIEGHDFEGFEAAWSPDGSRLATALLRSGRIRESPLHLWEAASGKLLHQWGRLRSRVQVADSTDCFQAPAWSPDGLYLASVDERRLWVWRVHSKRLERQMILKEPVQQVAWSPDGRILAARTFPDYWGSDAGQVARIFLWNARTGRALRTLHVPDRGLTDLAWSPDSRRLAASGRDGIVRIWEL